MENLEAITKTPGVGAIFLALGADTSYLVAAADNTLKTFKEARA